jgi:hypothetical protein
VKHPLSLQLLFPAVPLALDTVGLTRSLRCYHKQMRKASCEIALSGIAQGTPYGTVRWGDHAVELLGLDVPMPAHVVESCVQPALYATALKDQARAHVAHVLLYYRGQATAPIEQYAALAATAGALCEHGAIFVLNETGHTSVPASLLAPVGDHHHLREMPILYLYAGFVMLAVDGVAGIWARTYGCHALALPDLAYHGGGSENPMAVHRLLSNALHYLAVSGAKFRADRTFEIDGGVVVRVRAPTGDEHYLASEGELFVISLAT